MEKENVDTTDLRTPDEIKTEYDKKIDAAKKQIEEMKEKINKFKDDYFNKLNHYEDYFDLVSYIKMVNEEKDKIKERKAEEEKRKKEREDLEKQKQKEFEERQKRREERKQRDEERKKQEEERREKLKKEREDYINRNPHHSKIETCENLIAYCDDLRPENAEKKLVKREEKEYKQIQELKPSDNKEWAKELQKGAEVIVSKKLKEDVEVPKKQKKEKKKKEESAVETSGFTHHIDISKRFEQVNLLPPLMASEIDDTIKQLKERIEIYQKPTEEEIAAFKVKAEKEFDEMHGLGEGEKKGQFREKRAEKHEEEAESPEQKDKYRGRKGEKKSKALNENDFPELD